MNKEYLGNAIRITRIANDFSIKQLAERTGLSSTFISEIEKGNKNISLDNFKIIAKVLNINSSQLMEIVERYSGFSNDTDKLTKFQLTLMTALELIIKNKQLNQNDEITTNNFGI